MKRYNPVLGYNYEEPYGTMDEIEDGEYVLHREACPQWTTEVPKRDGAYWVREENDTHSKRLAEIETTHGKTYVYFVGCEYEATLAEYVRSEEIPPQWCGPLYEPKD